MQLGVARKTLRTRKGPLPIGVPMTSQGWALRSQQQGSRLSWMPTNASGVPRPSVESIPVEAASESTVPTSVSFRKLNSTPAKR